MGLVTALAFFTCIVLHEFGHAFVARSRGMPISGITLFLFGGVSELGEEPRSAGTEFLMADRRPPRQRRPGRDLRPRGRGGLPRWLAAPVVIVLGYLAAINGIVLIFNMVPAFPARRRPRAALDPLGRDRQRAAGDALGLATPARPLPGC